MLEQINNPAPTSVVSSLCSQSGGNLNFSLGYFGCISRRFGTKCAGCLQGISPNDLVRKARSKVFHLNCFTCMVCNKQLSTGEELYVIDENKFVCKEDFLSSGATKEANLNSGKKTIVRWRRTEGLCCCTASKHALVFK